MNQQDILKIENKLNVDLPTAYKESLLNYPIPAYVGNADTMFWDDADSIIELNLLLRTKVQFRDAWSKRFYALGEDDGGCSDAIDLEDENFGVFWFDRQHIDVKSKQRSDEKIGDWIKRQYDDYTHDLEADGIDPNGTPENRGKIEESNSKGGCLSLILLVVIGVLIVISILFFK